MFEKEAEEYYYKTYPVTLNIGEEERKKEVTDIFIKGAEFGYNKAKEEMQEQIEKMQEQIEKMKCCHNCRKFHNLSYDCTCAEVCNEWEIKENE